MYLTVLLRLLEVLEEDVFQNDLTGIQVYTVISV